MNNVKANQDIRVRLSACKIPMWRLAKAANISEPTITRWMREDLQRCDPRRTQLLIALSQLEKENAAGGGHGEEEEVDSPTV